MEPIYTQAVPPKRQTSLVIFLVVLLIIILGALAYLMKHRQASVPVDSGPMAITPTQVLVADPGTLADATLQQFIIFKDASTTDSSIQAFALNGATTTSSVVRFTTHTRNIDVYKAYYAAIPGLGYNILKTDTTGALLTIFAAKPAGESAVVTITEIDTTQSSVAIFLNKPSK